MSERFSNNFSMNSEEHEATSESHTGIRTLVR
jgi:hypothetical protein